MGKPSLEFSCIFRQYSRLPAIRNAVIRNSRNLFPVDVKTFQSLEIPVIRKFLFPYNRESFSYIIYNPGTPFFCHFGLYFYSMARFTRFGQKIKIKTMAAQTLSTLAEGGLVTHPM